MSYTPRQSEPKSETLRTRVTPSISDLAHAAAEKLGLDVSEWLRMLVIQAVAKEER